MVKECVNVYAPLYCAFCFLGELFSGSLVVEDSNHGDVERRLR